MPVFCSVGVAKMYSAKHGYEMLPSSEMKALGTVNMFGPLFQSFVVMGAFSRSAVNDNAGAKSQLSNVVSSIVVVLMLLFITPALFYLPKAVLSAIIVMAVVGLVDWRGLKRLWHVDKRDFLTMLAAFLATLFLGVLYGVIAALTFSTIIFIGMTTQPVVEELGRVGGTVIYRHVYEDTHTHARILLSCGLCLCMMRLRVLLCVCRHVGMVGVSKVAGVKIIKFLAPLFFANCTVLRDRTFRELVERRSAPPKLKWKAIVLCFASVASIDTTSIQVRTTSHMQLYVRCTING
jgi:MFS superfamily sulfate permease-like transporter